MTPRDEHLRPEEPLTTEESAKLSSWWQSASPCEVSADFRERFWTRADLDGVPVPERVREQIGWPRLSLAARRGRRLAFVAAAAAAAIVVVVGWWGWSVIQDPTNPPGEPDAAPVSEAGLGDESRSDSREQGEALDPQLTALLQSDLPLSVLAQLDETDMVLAADLEYAELLDAVDGWDPANGGVTGSWVPVGETSTVEPASGEGGSR